MELKEPFKQDKQGLYYLDSKDVILEPFNFNELLKPYTKQRTFYHISDVSDYIVKDTTRLPKYFNGYKTKKFLEKIYEKEGCVPEVDFPVGYLLDEGKVKGTVVPYYKDSLSIRKLSIYHQLENLKNFYYRSDNNNKNLIYLCLEILDIVEKLYNEDIIYTDLSTTNFLVYNNMVKIIDFEPNYVFFTKNKKRYLDILLSNYNILIDSIWRNYQFTDVLYSPGDSFEEQRNRVKALIRKRRG